MTEIAGLTVSIDNTRLLLRLRNGQKRLAYAVANAVNATSKRVQAAEFENVRAKFVVRKPGFFFGTPARPGGVAARIQPFASAKQGRPFSEVFVARASTAKSQRRLLLSVFEEGGVKSSTQGGRGVAIPLTGGPARPTMAQPVDPKFTFAGMKLQAHRGKKRLTRTIRNGRGKTRKVGIGLFGEFGRLGLPTDGGGVTWKGRHRTFLLSTTRRAPSGGVYQRTGPKRGDVRIVWKFQRNVAVKRLLGFKAVAKRTADAWFKEEMERQVIASLKFHRGEGT